MISLMRYDIPKSAVKLSVNEVLSVLGSTEETKEYVQTCIGKILGEAEKLLRLKGGLMISKEIIPDKTGSIITIQNTSFEVRDIVFQQLKKSEWIAVFACTAGDEIFQKSRSLINSGDYLSGYIYDIYGSLAVEKAMDHIQNDLREQMLKEGLNISNRYSPGYCGWDVAEQQKLFSLLPQGFCGITLNDSCLMQPIKSVSGFIGIGKEVVFDQYSCHICESARCLYRNLKSKQLN